MVASIASGGIAAATGRSGPGTRFRAPSRRTRRAGAAEPPPAREAAAPRRAERPAADDLDRDEIPLAAPARVAAAARAFAAGNGYLPGLIVDRTA
jgi:hypothetical protein